jgi:hypothetical protein
MDESEKTLQVRMLQYQNRTNDMRQMKSQQWIIVYYCSLVFAGIIGFASALKSIHPSGLLPLFGVSIFITTFGLWAIINNQILLRDDRRITMELESQFHVNLIRNRKPNRWYVSYCYHLYYWLMFKLAVLLGLFFTVWILFQKHQFRFNNYCILWVMVALVPSILFVVTRLILWLTQKRRGDFRYSGKSSREIFDEQWSGDC